MENEDIQEILKIFPIWDSSVWEALQKKQYDTAERNLKFVLENIDLDDLSLAYWQGIFSGIPAVLGDLSEEEWKNMVRPAILRALIGAVSGKGLSEIIQDLEPAEQLDFINLFLKNIPGATSEEKVSWLKEQRPSLFMLVLGAPGQELRLNPKQYSGGISIETLIKKYKILPKNLKNCLFSYDNAEEIFRMGKNNHFSDEKISLLARLVGRVILGFIHPEDFKKEIESDLQIDGRIAEVLANNIQSKIFYPIMSDLRDVYEPMNIEKDSSVNEKEIEIPISEFSSGAEETIPVISSEKPFILHEEKSQASEEKKSSFKGFSMPFGFFKSKNQPAPVGK
ncbi:MAG: hypothetical protein AABX72_01465, partial [Nanoarchaeota archaeon]